MYDPLDGTADEETPEVLQEDLLKIQSQFPMMHKYVKVRHKETLVKLRSCHTGQFTGNQLQLFLGLIHYLTSIKDLLYCAIFS